jgi:hypothetical protein
MFGQGTAGAPAKGLAPSYGINAFRSDILPDDLRRHERRAQFLRA